MEQPAAVILAAGRGRRMKSDLPKVLHPLCGRPMLAYIVDAVRRAGVRRIIVVVGRDVERMRAAIGPGVEYVIQREPRGSGHALLQAMPRLRNHTVAYVVNGDMPFISTSTLRALRQALRGSAGSAAAALATGTVQETHRFGRIIRGPANQFLRIVEDEDATPEEAAVREVNAGFYCFRVPDLRRVLGRVRTDNRQKEYYLPDAVTLLAAEGRPVVAVTVSDPEEMTGVNSREELAQAAAVMRRRILSRLMETGVTVVDPASTFVEEGVRVDRDTVIHPCTILTGRTAIGAFCSVGPGARIHDSVLGRRVSVRDSSLEGARLGDGTVVGPYAHLRPGTVVGRAVEIGNYAEMKNTRVGDRTKVHHKSYLGDALVGADVNIGAGTITCNYGTDRRKHRTTIEDGAYIGSDSMLVAPVRIGRGAITGAGAVVTKNVPPRTVVVGVPARVTRVLNRRR